MKQRFSKRTRLVSALLTLAMVFTFLPFSAFADDDVDFWVPLHSENFPDKTFLEYIRTTFDKGGSEDGEPNGILEPGEWRAVTTIDVRNKNITSLWGITCFRNLKKLNCSDNQLTSLNLSYNTKLTQENLKCTGNKYPITIDETERTFDLSTLPAGFDVNKASEWVGGTVEGNTLKVNEGVTEVTYTYDCGKDCNATFTLNVKVVPDGTLTPPEPPVTPPSGGGDGGGAVVIVAAAGAVVAGVVGYGVYNYVSGQKLQALLPEGVAAPENRAQTALLLWNTAGRPEPAEAPAFADVADPDTAKAAQWCVEQGLMKRRLNGKFAPGSSIPAYQVLNAYRKLAG